MLPLIQCWMLSAGKNSGDTILNFLKTNFRRKNIRDSASVSELASLLGVICALISFRCCWEDNPGMERPDRKVNGKKGKSKILYCVPEISPGHRDI